MYHYVCGACDFSLYTNIRADWIPCRWCGARAQRRWRFSVLPSMPAGFNPTTGTVVRNRADLRSQLDRASEQSQQPRTVWDGHGEPHQVTPAPAQYVPVDLRDKEACGVTPEGLDVTYDALRRSGNDPAADRLRRLID